jgi:hypothetical protein
MKTAMAAILGVVGLGLLILAAQPAAPMASAHQVPRKAPPVIQLAILLDTSNSMDGLIDQARSQLWRIVNDYAAARQGGEPVSLRVALYEYGNSRIPQERGYVRQVVPFTSDLDRLSEALFALTTHGGDEYCGQVIQSALDELDWGRTPSDLRVVFIAGNEPFTQGPVDFRRAVQRARSQGIVVNTIHCGPQDVGERTGWREGAVLAAGTYTTIDQGKAVAHVDAPQDAEIARLGIELNKTYIPYGATGAEGKARQEAQDGNAMSQKGIGTYRAVTKANRLYSNAGWDLVDAVKQGQVDVAKVPAASLPPEMQGLSAGERAAYVTRMAAERARLQAHINELNVEREKHVAGARQGMQVADDTFDAVLAKTLREQAGRKGIELR